MLKAIGRGVAAVALVGFASVASAQTTQPPSTPPATPGSAATIPEKTPSSPGAAGTVSDKLEKSDGVIKPPSGIDPAMAKGAPDTSTPMPVIKPMEEKGGPVAK